MGYLIFFFFSCKDTEVAVSSDERGLFIMRQNNAGYLKLSSDSGSSENTFSLKTLLWALYFLSKL